MREAASHFRLQNAIVLLAILHFQIGKVYTPSRVGIADALSFMRIAAIIGPRQSGKSMLARLLAGDGALHRSLDEADQLSFARSDPVGFLDVGDRRLVAISRSGLY